MCLYGKWYIQWLLYEHLESAPAGVTTNAPLPATAIAAAAPTVNSLLHMPLLVVVAAKYRGGADASSRVAHERLRGLLSFPWVNFLCFGTSFMGPDDMSGDMVADDGDIPLSFLESRLVDSDRYETAEEVYPVEGVGRDTKTGVVD